MMLGVLIEVLGQVCSYSVERKREELARRRREVMYARLEDLAEFEELVWPF